MLVRFLLFLAAVIGSGWVGTVQGQKKDVDHAVAARFAPIFYQALGENPRSDLITNFNFDGDWRGDNNWVNTDKFPLKAYVYYSVSETSTHFFVHYAVFHPRDYKGGEQRGRLLSEALRQGARILGDRDPTKLLDKATLAHENDLEGALVVVEKKGSEPADARVTFVQTLAHNSFAKYAAERAGFSTFRSDGQRPLLYIEPRGHGIRALAADEEKQIRSSIIYRYTGKAEEPTLGASTEAGYDLLPIATTLWSRARPTGKSGSVTYGTTHDYGSVSITISGLRNTPTARKVALGKLGSAFLGTSGGENMARPPWGWFDIERRQDPQGLWFFDPATVTKRDFGLNEGFSNAYIRPPFWARRP